MLNHDRGFSGFVLGGGVSGGLGSGLVSEVSPSAGGVLGWLSLSIVSSFDASLPSLTEGVLYLDDRGARLEPGALLLLSFVGGLSSV